MSIRRWVPGDAEILVNIWLRSVRATHAFLTEDDIQCFLPMAREYLSSPASDLWVLESDSHVVMGFMGLTENKVEALFLAPEFQRCGGGRRLIQHARQVRGELTVDVNEQNPAACRFYEACGFVTFGRSDLDSTGRPFPLLHMRLAAIQKQGAARTL
jgi:putative acetyltransferase